MAAMERPQLILIAGLAVLGALAALSELFTQLDRLHMAATTTDDLDRLPTTEEEGER